MNRHRITAESIDDENIELLRALGIEFSLKGKPCITLNNLHFGRAIRQITEKVVILGNPDHTGVDLVETEAITFQAISRQGPGPQADHPDVKLRAHLTVVEHDADSSSQPVIGKRAIAHRGVETLGSMQCASVNQEVKVRLGALILHRTGEPPEVACHDMDDPEEISL